MTSGAIPFANLQESGYDELGGASPIAVNVMVDARGVVSKRPGIEAATGLATSSVIEATGLSGVYATNDGNIFAVGDTLAERNIYRVTAAGATALNSGGSPHGLRGNERPVFAETEMLLLLAGGREPQKVELATLLSNRLGGSPPIATHVIANNNRLLMNDIQADKTKARYSDVALGTTTYAGHESWSLAGVGTSGYFTAEARPDNVVALGENTGEVFVWGTGTTQTFGPDASLVYAPIATIELGMGAAYSSIKQDAQFHWFDHKRRFVTSDGRGYDHISKPIQKQLDAMATVNDCFGARVTGGNVDQLLWTFPTDGRSFAYQKGVGWAQWMGWDTGTGNWSRLIVNGFASVPGEATTLVCTTTGRIGKFSVDAATDFGAPIVARVVTGYLNRETENKKQCLAVRLALRRGQTTEQAYFGFRDRPGDEWTRIPIELGPSGDTETVVEFRSLGVYRRRQWYFEFSGDSALALVSATEEYEVLEV